MHADDARHLALVQSVIDGDTYKLVKEHIALAAKAGHLATYVHYGLCSRDKLKVVMSRLEQEGYRYRFYPGYVSIGW